MGPTEFAAIGALVVAFSIVSMRVERLPITMPMVFVGAGAFTEAIGFIDLSAERESISLLAEITLGVILFTDAARIDIARLRRYLSIPVRLLGIGLPLIIVMGTMVNRLLFPDLPLAQVALLAAILAPTDAALGSAVIEDSAVPARERLAISVESGVNDGLVVPVVTFLTAIVISEGRSAGSWAGFVVQQIGWGVVVGAIVGGATISLLRWAHRRGWSDARFEQLATFAVPLVAIFGAEALSGNSFIAAFVAGMAFGSFGADTRSASSARFVDFTEDSSQLLGIAAFFVFGNVLVSETFDQFTVPVVACALLTLTVGRMLPVWISLIGTHLRGPTRLFIGWFGPRGLASIVFGLLLLEETDSMAGAGENLFGVIALTVTASVVLHGATAAWGARRYGAWADAAETGTDEMDEMDETMVPRSRWARPRS